MACRSNKGFTLIELLVVITIISVLLSIVAPLMIEQVDKLKASAEFREAEQYVSDSAKVAFLRGQTVHFNFDGKQLSRSVGPEQINLEFDYLFFPQQLLQFNANGFPDRDFITVMRGRVEQKIALTRSK